MFLREAEALLFFGREIIMGNPERANKFNVAVDWLRYDVFFNFVAIFLLLQLARYWRYLVTFFAQ